ncbi:MAG: hypothetical protein OIF50_02320 [Flavobacteriaceae bacterium]|nr:hypothetical protein [Flavobacteriaceae bacterium]
MRNLLNSNIFLIAFAVVLICFLISFISNDVVLNDKVYHQFLNEKYEHKYNEYKDLDIELLEFEKELKQFEQDSEDINQYSWDAFYVDSIFVLVPLIIFVLSYSATFLIMVLFHKDLYSIKFIQILKTSILSFLVFYIPEIVSSVYFLVFDKNYNLNDLNYFESHFRLNVFFKDNDIPKYLFEVLSQTGFEYFLFPLCSGLMLSILYKNLKCSLIIGYSFFAYFILYIFYNTIIWYLFDLV